MGELAHLTEQVGLLLAEVRAQRDEKRELASEVRSLRQAIERGRGAAPPFKPCKPADRKALNALLPEIDREIGTGVVLTTRDLIERTRSGNTRLRAVFEKLFGKGKGAEVARTVGDLFKRNVGIVHGAFRVVRVDTDRAGALWMLERRD